MEMLKLLGMVSCTVTILSLLRRYQPDFSILASIAAALILSAYLFSLCAPLVSFFENLAVFSQLEHFRLLLKAIGIGFVSQTAADFCAESGQQALSNKVLLAGKLFIIFVTLPLFETVFHVLHDLLQS